ncbi:MULTISPECIES: hypothetical protein [Bacillus cereus group]|uniref:hypothetical protein n=1 Tax=Bacillus cereus group TaxID=86661 RepID=UPI0024AD6726|nr:MULTISPECIES: hypothetical protein [Bacillus cereus group]MDI6678838.1 hypothetical protein [Bacillus wiedmannii]MDM5254953.1 hypothetical protein [Bacillus toyonensis]
MKILEIKELENIQNDYTRLVESYSDTFKTGEFDYSIASSFIEEVEVFWLERLDSARLLLDMLTSNNECYLLSGAIYLDSKNNEHFFLKTLGDYQIVSDPFIKMEPFIRNNLVRMGRQKTKDFFMKVFRDTYNVLTECKNNFIILPVTHLAWSFEKEKHMEILREIHLNFISGILGKEIKSVNNFYELYKSYAQIIEDLDEFYIDNLIFNGIEDTEIGLDERINKYIETNVQEMRDNSEVEKFMLSTYTMIAQITDILLITLNLRLIPFIRYDVTFRYFLMMNKLVREDKETSSMLNKTILAYLFYERYSNRFFNDFNYNEYVSKLKDYNLLEDVSSTLNLKNNQLEDYGVQEIIETISVKFEKIIINNQRPNNNGKGY